MLDTELKLNCTAVGPATLSVEWSANKSKSFHTKFCLKFKLLLVQIKKY